MTEIKQEDFSAALFGFLKNVAVGVTVAGTIGGATWYIFGATATSFVRDIFNDMYSEIQKTQDMRQRQIEQSLSKQADILSRIESRVGVNVPFIEFHGRGAIAGAGPFKAGETVPIEYFMKRNSPCSTEVTVQFYSARWGRVLTQYTTVIVATQAAPTFTFAPFTVDLKIPEDLPPGMYSYRPTLKPDRSECPGQSDAVVPPSLFFEVVTDD